MPVVFEFPRTDFAGRLFVGWTPIRGTVRLTDSDDPFERREVVLRNAGWQGRVWFADGYADEGASELRLTLPGDGSPVEFWMAGELMMASERYGDAIIEAVDAADSSPLGTQSLMVRVRKDANTLTPFERDRFLSTLGILNGRGFGRFTEIRDMHQNYSNGEAHGNSAFLPWHRAFILDLERELQAIDAEVTLPYWRFDAPAPNVFTHDFMGLPDNVGIVQFTPGHPLENWVTDSQLGILRRMIFDPNTAPTGPISEFQTLALGGQGNDYRGFIGMEGNPHGSAHISFRGFLGSIGSAARDPLFFMLHANVDRLWAKWQWLHARHDRARQAAYTPPFFGRVGHNLDDDMWPWNGVTFPPRPALAPGGALAASQVTDLPGPRPTVVQMMDYANVRGGEDLPSGGTLGFWYDDVPYQHEPEDGGLFA